MTTHLCDTVLVEVSIAVKNHLHHKRLIGFLVQERCGLDLVAVDKATASRGYLFGLFERHLDVAETSLIAQPLPEYRKSAQRVRLALSSNQGVGVEPGVWGSGPHLAPGTCEAGHDRQSDLTGRRIALAAPNPPNG
jgi:hypothetical protein